jgi:hypothetical protein
MASVTTIPATAIAVAYPLVWVPVPTTWAIDIAVDDPFHDWAAIPINHRTMHFAIDDTAHHWTINLTVNDTTDNWTATDVLDDYRTTIAIAVAVTPSGLSRCRSETAERECRKCRKTLPHVGHDES